MKTPTLDQIVLDALTNQTSPVQAAGVPYDPDQYEIVGDVPMAVRHLHNASCAAIDQLNELGKEFETTPSNTIREEILAQINTLQLKSKALSNLRWALMAEAFPKDQSIYDGMVIMEDWKMAGELKSAEDDLPDELKALIAHLRDGNPGDGAGIGIMVMASPRS